MSVFTNEVVVNGEVQVDGSGHTQPVSGPLTDAELRATAVPVTVSGTVDVGNFPATQNVAVTSIVEAEIKNDSGNPIPVVSGNAASSTITQSVISSSVNTTVLAANAARKKIVIFASKSTLYVKLGATASSASFTYALVSANSTLEITGWGGQVDVLSTVNGNIVTVTELV